MNEIEAINLALDEGKQQGKKEMLEWLEKERDKIREYNSNQKEESDFMKGWLKGSSDGAEALFEAAKKRADEK